MTIRVALLIPGVLLRSGLRALLLEQADIDLVGAGTSADALAGSADPDVLIVSLPPDGGRDLAEYLKQLRSDPAILVVSDDPAGTIDLESLSVRAWGILPGDASEDELLAALPALNAGLNVQTPELFSVLLRASRKESDRPENELAENLTDREQEVLQLLTQGLANKQIAFALSISEHTVKFHVSSIYGKLGASNRTEAVRLGLQNGLITL